MVWEPELEELERRRRLAAEMGGTEGIERQRRRGKLTVRERIAALADPDTFREIGGLAGSAQYDGEKLASFTEVSHAYERPSFEGWPYHLFTMIHGQTEQEVRDIARRMSEAVGIDDYDVLFSIREFKKTSMQYFDHWPDREGK